MLDDSGWLAFNGWVWTIIFQKRRDRAGGPTGQAPAAGVPALVRLSVFLERPAVPAGRNERVLRSESIAWNCLISWWLLIIDIFGWLMLTFYLLLKAIKRQEVEGGSSPSGDDIEARLDAIERRLDVNTELRA